MINSLTSKPNLHEQQKHGNTAKENPSSDKDKKNIECWLYLKPHRLMDYDIFKAKSLDKRKEYVKTKKLYFNCFSKGHSLKDCNSKYQCCVNNCNKKHSSIHYETVSSNSLSIKEHLTNNNSDNSNKINQTARDKGVTHSQVLPINVSFREKTFESKIPSKLVNFSISLSHHPSPINISNAWVVENLNLPAYRMKNDFAHLRDIKLEQLHDKSISILIVADKPHLHLYTESRIGNTNEPVALLTTLGWVLMGRKSNNSKISTNFFKRKWKC